MEYLTDEIIVRAIRSQLEVIFDSHDIFFSLMTDFARDYVQEDEPDNRPYQCLGLGLLVLALVYHFIYLLAVVIEHISQKNCEYANQCQGPQNHEQYGSHYYSDYHCDYSKYTSYPD